MRFQLVLSLLALASPSFSNNSKVVEPTADNLHFSVQMLTDVARLGLKGNVKSYRASGGLEEFFYMFDEKGYFLHEENPDGSFAYHSVYDERGNRIETRKMQLLPKIQTWQEQYLYDKNNRVVEELQFAPDGNVAEYDHYYYDKRGHLLKRETMTEDGKIVTIKYKISPYGTLADGRKVTKYDSLGAWKETRTGMMSYVCPDSSVLVHPDFKWVNLLKDGNITERLSYKRNGLGGYALEERQIYTYDNSGLLISISSDKLKCTFEYDSVGNKVAEHWVYLDSHKEITVTYTIGYY